MRYAKLINSQPVYAPNPILVDGSYIGNPPDSVYEEEGYKPVRTTEPGEAPEGFAWVPHWEEQAEEIVQVWELEELPKTNEIPDEEALNIILGGADT